MVHRVVSSAKITPALFAVFALLFGLFAAVPAQAATSASVSGTITGPGGAALVDVDELYVELERQDGTSWDWEDDAYLDAGESDFSFAGLRPGTYRILVISDGGNYADTYSSEFTLAAGQVKSGVDIALDVGASVSGTITGPGGAALVDVDNISVRAERKYEDEGGTWWDWDEPTWLEEGETAYTVSGLRSGTYRILVESDGGNYADTYSSEFTLTTAQTKTGVDIALDAGASVSGTITGPGGAALVDVDELYVELERRDGTWWEWEDDVSLDAGESDFSFAGLRPGTYRIRILVESDGGNYADTYSSEFTLTAAQTKTGVDIALDAGASVSGSITGPGGAALVDVDGLYVKAERKYEDEDGTWWDWDESTWLEEGETAYTVSGLRSGTYRILVESDGGNYVDTSSGEFTLTAGQTKSGVDFELETGASVSGTITGPGGAALVDVDGLWLDVQRKVLNDGETTWELEREKSLDAGETAYTIDGLRPGTYRVRALPGGENYLNTYSAEFTLTPGQSVSGINVELALDLGPASVSGTITGPNGVPLVDVDELLVSVYYYFDIKGSQGWEFEDWVLLSGNERDYTLNGLNPGSIYRIRVEATGGNYVDTYSTEFTLESGQIQTGFDIALDAGPDLDLVWVVPSVSGTAQVGEVLTAVPGAWTAGTGFGYQWLRGGAVISGATSSTYTLVAADAGKQVSVRVTGSKAGYTTVSKTSASVAVAVPVVAKPVVKAGKPSFTGTVRVGSKLTAKSGTWPKGTGLKYQWLRDGKAISKATKKTYTLKAADSGKRVSVRVTGTLAGHSDGVATSSSKKVAVGKLKSATPKLKGSAKVGKTLKVTRGSWTSGTKYTYVWYANGKVIKGAKKSSLKLKKAQQGKKITVKVTGKKTGYKTVSKKSKATKKVKKK